MNFRWGKISVLGRQGELRHLWVDRSSGGVTSAAAVVIGAAVIVCPDIISFNFNRRME